MGTTHKTYELNIHLYPSRLNNIKLYIYSVPYSKFHLTKMFKSQGKLSPEKLKQKASQQSLRRVRYNLLTNFHKHDSRLEKFLQKLLLDTQCLQRCFADNEAYYEWFENATEEKRAKFVTKTLERIEKGYSDPYDDTTQQAPVYSSERSKQNFKNKIKK